MPGQSGYFSKHINNFSTSLLSDLRLLHLFVNNLKALQFSTLLKLSSNSGSSSKYISSALMTAQKQSNPRD